MKVSPGIHSLPPKCLAQKSIAVVDNLSAPGTLTAPAQVQ